MVPPTHNVESQPFLSRQQDHLDLLVVMATGRGGLGASGSGYRGVRVGVGKEGGACRGDHMKGPGFDCTFLEEERVSHDRQVLPSE